MAAAAAEIAGERLAYLLLAGTGRVAEERTGGNHETGRAVAALRRLLRDEGGLERIGLLGAAQALDGDHVAVAHAARRRNARADSPPAHEDAARPALGEAATEVSAGEAEVVAQHVEERDVGIIGVDLARAPVHPERDLGHGCLSASRREWRWPAPCPRPGSPSPRPWRRRSAPCRRSGSRSSPRERAPCCPGRTSRRCPSTTCRR